MQGYIQGEGIGLCADGMAGLVVERDVREAVVVENLSGKHWILLEGVDVEPVVEIGFVLSTASLHLQWPMLAEEAKPGQPSAGREARVLTCLQSRRRVKVCVWSRFGETGAMTEYLAALVSAFHAEGASLACGEGKVGLRGSVWVQSGVFG